MKFKIGKEKVHKNVKTLLRDHLGKVFLPTVGVTNTTVLCIIKQNKSSSTSKK